MMMRPMVGLLFIEISAFHTFAWAEDVLSDARPRRRRRRGGRARVATSARDETPHVDYLAHRAHRDARPHVRRRVGRRKSRAPR